MYQDETFQGQNVVQQILLILVQEIILALFLTSKHHIKSPDSYPKSVSNTALNSPSHSNSKVILHYATYRKLIFSPKLKNLLIQTV
jgi:hypothetical protein